MMATLSNYYGTRAFASLAGLAIAINTGVSSPRRSSRTDV
jgi:hypothetical protein